jgi:hypothetical protein
MRRDPLALLLVLVTVGIFAMSIYQRTFPPGADRIDGWFYGRYSDTAWAIIAAIGIAYVIRIRWPLVTAIAVATTAITGLGMWILTVPKIAEREFWQSVHVLGIEPWLSLEHYGDGEPQNWAWLSALPALLCVLLGALAFIRWWLLPVFAVLITGLTISTDEIDLDIRHGSRPVLEDPFGIGSFPEGVRFGADPALRQNLNMLTYYAGGRQIVAVPVDQGRERVDVIFLSFFIEVPEDDDARQLRSTEGGAVTAWVYPGDLQDQLARDDLLVETP